MKKRIIKSVLPLLAFMLATAFAFATDQKSPGISDPQPGAIFEDGLCKNVLQVCNNQSTTACVYGNGAPIYYRNTSCTVQMTHRPE